MVTKKDVKKVQEEEFNKALQNNDYKALVKKIKMSEKDAQKNTIKLLDTIEELGHCKNCDSLYECQNKIKGYVYFPEKKRE